MATLAKSQIYLNTLCMLRTCLEQIRIKDIQDFNNKGHYHISLSLQILQTCFDQAML